jgi:nucleosome binding factor SPN SPT16 subunit
MDIITDLEKFANKKIKMRKKDFCRRRYLIFKEGDIMGGFAKDMIQGRTCSHCGIMFEKRARSSSAM